MENLMATMEKEHLTSYPQGSHESCPSYTSVPQVTNKTSIIILILISIKRPHKGVHLSWCLWGHMSLTLRPSPHPLSLPPLEQLLIKTLSSYCTKIVPHPPSDWGADRNQHQSETNARGLPGQRCNESRHDTSAALQGGVGTWKT